MHFNVLMCVNPTSIISLILKYGTNPASASTIGLHIWSTHTHWKRFLSNSCIFSQLSKAYPSVKHLNRALSTYLPICSMRQSNISHKPIYTVFPHICEVNTYGTQRREPFDWLILLRSHSAGIQHVEPFDWLILFRSHSAVWIKHWVTCSIEPSIKKHCFALSSNI